MPTVNLIIKGKVQGVYYRNAAKEEANKLGITGWIKYLNDGRIEVMATGSDEQLEKFISWCRVGPQKAEVSDVIITPLTEQNFESFEINFENYPADI